MVLLFLLGVKYHWEHGGALNLHIDSMRKLGILRNLLGRQQFPHTQGRQIPSPGHFLGFWFGPLRLMIFVWEDRAVRRKRCLDLHLPSGN